MSALPLLALGLVLAQTPAELSEAEALARDALTRYQAGEPRAAAELFERAFALSRRASPLRNAARAYEAAGDARRAIDAWTRYLALGELDEPRRRAATDAIHALEERPEALTALSSTRTVTLEIEPYAPTQGLGDTAPAPAIDEPILSTWWFWTAAGALALGAGVSIGLAAGGAFTETRLRHQLP